MRSLLLFAALAAASGQTASFEVVSIKPSAPQEGSRSYAGDSGGPGSQDPERWRCENLSTWNLLLIAFDIRPNDLVGPDWLHQPRFDINAKLPKGATRAQFREMMQNMLVDRFGLKAHREKREVSGYELVVAKGGPKFKAADPNAPKNPGPGIASSIASDMTMDATGFPTIPPGRSGYMAAGDRIRIQWVAATLDRVARSLTNDAGRPVVNATGLAGNFDVSLYYVRASANAAPPAPGGAEMPSASDPGGPSLFRAVQEQLGLELKAKKVSQDVLVVEDVKRMPTEN